MVNNNLKFIHHNENLDIWRNSLKGGISFHDDDLNYIKRVD